MYIFNIYVYIKWLISCTLILQTVYQDSCKPYSTIDYFYGFSSFSQSHLPISHTLPMVELVVLVTH